MRRRLRKAAQSAGDTLPGNECLGVMIRRWEKGTGGVSERYRLHYCKAFQIPIDQFGYSRPAAEPDSPEDSAAEPAGGAAQQAMPSAARAIGSTSGGPVARLAARPNSSSIADEIQVTASESSEHAEQAEACDFGAATLEQFRAAVVRFSRESMTGEPVPLFFRMRSVRDRMHAGTGRRIRAADRTELYFLLAALHSLMAGTAQHLGSPEAAEELARAGGAYATAIRHQSLLAQLRLNLAVTAHWDHRPQAALQLADAGLGHQRHGPRAAQLQLMRARALARLGDADAARDAITTAATTRDLDQGDDLAGLGGAFTFSLASHHYFAGSALLDIPGADTDAGTELGHAIKLYAEGPAPGEDHSAHCEMTARADLAAVTLRAGDLDAAQVAAGPVLALPPGQRAFNLTPRLHLVRIELAAPRYQGSLQARQFDEQIEQFCRDTIAARLHDQPGPAPLSH